MTDTTAYERVTRRLAEITGYQPPNSNANWRCPAHPDRTPSLTVTNGEKGVVIVCRAGCETRDVVDKLGLRLADLFDRDPTPRANGTHRRIAATYDYTDPDGRLLYQVVRYDPKDFRQRRPVGEGQWEHSTAGIQRVLYRLPRVLEAVQTGAPIYITEGEKDVHAIETAGQTATCNAGGAGKWAHTDTTPLHGARDIIIIRDKDPAGAKHAADIEANLTGHVDRIRVAEARTGKDAADHLGAGHTLDQLIIVSEQRKPRPRAARAVPGGTFILDAPPTPTAVWGEDASVLWAAGEPLMINGPTGVGKTTIGQQVTLARAGLRGPVLGLPVAVEARRILYCACDRPRQAQRSMSRMVTEADRETLNEKLVFWPGPLPFRITKDPEQLAAFAEELDVGTIVIDSLKDVVSAPSNEEMANLANSAFQECSARDIELMVLHHQRKSQGDNKKPTSIDDVYGSTWLTAGMGSVILIWGQPGDLVVELSHLKQPAEPVGPWKLLHDHDIGHTTVQDGVNLLDVIRTSNGLTAEAVAKLIYETDTKPNKAQLERARRELHKLINKELVHCTPGGKSPVDGRQLPDRYYAVTRP